MRKILAIAVVAGLFAAGTAEAQAPAAPAKPESGFTMAFRLGYGLPLGDFASGVGMDQFLGGKVPLWVDLGYRIDRSMFIGAYFQYAFGTAAGTYQQLCDATSTDCSPSIMRIGVEFLYKFAPDASFAPWAGIGLGYENVTFSESGPLGTGSTDASGFEFLNLQLGGDFRVSPSFGLGPYLAFSMAQYSSVAGGSIANTATHEWLQFGVKGTFDL
jgi:hypothetical protein